MALPAPKPLVVRWHVFVKAAAAAAVPPPVLAVSKARTS